MQWRTELLRFTPPGFFSIYFYHGPKRESDPAVLATQRLVLLRVRARLGVGVRATVRVRIRGKF